MQTRTHKSTPNPTEVEVEVVNVEVYVAGVVKLVWSLSTVVTTKQ